MAEGRKLDGRRILVDVERGRVVPGWCALPWALSLLGRAWVSGFAAFDDGMAGGAGPGALSAATGEPPPRRGRAAA